MKKELSFSGDYTQILKGIAILLMLFHHLFGFPEWYTEGISYIGVPLRVNTLEYALGQFGHICVSLFAFLTGYGMFFSYKSGNILKKSAKKGAAFFVCYWLVLFGVAIPVNMALGKTDITPLLIFKNMFGYDTSLVSFAWYVRFYLAVLITLPVFYKLMTKYAFVTMPIFLIVPAIINYYLSSVPGINFWVIKGVYFTMEYFLWLPCVLMGLCFAKYDLFAKLGRLISRLGKGEIFICILAMLPILYLRTYKPDTIGVIFSFDSIYAPIFVFLAWRIVAALPEIFRKFLRLMGKHSMNIWFLHSLFFFRTWELMKIAYAPKISILIVIWVIILCLIVSKALNAVSDLILRKKAEEIKAKPKTEEKIPQKV